MERRAAPELGLYEAWTPMPMPMPIGVMMPKKEAIAHLRHHWVEGQMRRLIRLPSARPSKNLKEIYIKSVPEGRRLD